MLESIDLSQTISKDTYHQMKDDLVAKLVLLQQRAITAKIPMLLVFEGWDASGKGSCISNLVVNLDPRYLNVCTVGNANDAESRYPFMERFWSEMGEHGTMTIFDRSWYAEAVELLAKHLNDTSTSKKKRKAQVMNSLERQANYYGGDSRNEADALVASMASFEKQFADDGYVVIKFFLHITEAEQKARLEALAADPNTAWRVTKTDFKHNKRYGQYSKFVDTIITKTSYDYAPWYIVPSMDEHVALIMVLQVIVEALSDALSRKEQAQRDDESGKVPSGEVQAGADGLLSSFPLVRVPLLEDVTYDHRIERDVYDRELKLEQNKLSGYQRELYRRRIPLMIAYEGWDAAGKGGNIKRVASALDARDYHVVPSAAPTPIEKEHPFLWRYWTRLPKTGHTAIYDRTWYGRVLVERVEGFASAEEWRRAYEEINEFEWELEQWGAILIKFWIDVSPDEQLRRFQERQNDPSKQWKITDEDWRNREKYPEYKTAVDDMLRLTSTAYAPWVIIESDDKLYARIKALKTINAMIEAKLE